MFTLSKSNIVRAFFAFGVFVSLVRAPIAIAQEETRVNLPFTQVTQVVITEQKSSAISGAFVVKNSEDVYISGLSYDISIISPRPFVAPGELAIDAAQEYAYAHVRDSIALGPNEEKQVPFTMQDVPSIPSGAYRLRIQLISADGRSLDWGDAPLTVQSEVSTPFVTISSGAVLVTSKDPATNEAYDEWAPADGVNIAPGTPFGLTFTAVNDSANPVTGTVETTIAPLLVQDSTPETFVGNEVSIASGTQDIPISLIAPQKPGVYRIVTMIRGADHAQVSGVMRYQIVVTGASASIERMALSKSAVHAGETAEVFFSIVGPADRVSELDGTVEITLLSGDAPIGTTSSPVHLSQDAQTGSAAVTLSSDATQTLGLRIDVKDSSGNVLATSSLQFPDVAIGAQQSGERQASVSVSDARSPYVYGVVLLVLVGIGVWVTYVAKKKSSVPPVVLMLVFFLGAGLFMYQSSIANVDGITFHTCTWVSGLPCNYKNDKNGYLKRLSVYTKFTPASPFRSGDPVNYDIKISWLACQNAVYQGGIAVKVLRDGGAFIKSKNEANTASWTTLATKYFDDNTAGSHTHTTLTQSLIGTHTFAPQQNSKTTFWTFASLHWAQGSSYTHDYTVDDFRWLPFLGADLSLSKTGPTAIELGQPVTYTVTVSNAGPQSATSVVVTDTVPAGLTFNAAGSSAACTLSGTTISCAIPTIATSASSALTLAFTSTLPATCTASSITNTATVTSSSPDPVSTNNSSSVTTTTTCPAPVTVTLVATPPAITLGSSSTLSWTSTNADTCTATGGWTGAKVPNGSEQATPITTGTHTFTITCTNAASGLTDTKTASIIVNALAGAANQAPISVVGIMVNGRLGTVDNPVEVTQGEIVNVQLIATGSDDPDGWDNLTKGVAHGGKCEWNADLSQDGSLEFMRTNPPSPASCDISDLSAVTRYPIVFNDALGIHIYDLLRITDVALSSSTIARASVNVVARTYQCNNGIDDNDAEDSLIDSQDPGCHTDGNASNASSYDPTDDDERNTAALAQCSNGVDDGDTEDALADAQDPGCHSDGNAGNSGSYVPTDNDETNSTSGNGGNGGSGSGGFQETR